MKITAILTAAAAALMMIGPARAETVGAVSAAGFADEQSRAIAATAPIDKSRVEIRWSTPEAEIAGAPLVYGSGNTDAVLLPVGNELRKYSLSDGKPMGKVGFGQKVSKSIRGAVLGDTAVIPARSSLYLVNIPDMTVSAAAEFGEILTDCAMLNGKVYFGYRTADGQRFACADGELNEIYALDLSSSESDPIMTSPALYNGFIIIGINDKLAIFEAEPGETGFIEYFDAGAAVTNVFAGKYAIFFTCADGTLKKLRLNADGSPEDGSLMTLDAGSGLTAPAELNNRLYMGSDDGFLVIDALNMELIKSCGSLKGASEPLICTGAGQWAYTVAWSPEEERYVLYSFLDDINGSTDELTMNEVIKIIDYSEGFCTAARNGTMLFRTADGRLWAIAMQKNSTLIIVIKLILLVALFVMLFLILREWAKRRADKRPKF